MVLPMVFNTWDKFEIAKTDAFLGEETLLTEPVADICNWLKLLILSTELQIQFFNFLIKSVRFCMVNTFK